MKNLKILDFIMGALLKGDVSSTTSCLWNWVDSQNGTFCKKKIKIKPPLTAEPCCIESAVQKNILIEHVWTYLVCKQTFKVVICLWLSSLVTLVSPTSSASTHFIIELRVPTGVQMNCYFPEWLGLRRKRRGKILANLKPLYSEV